MHNYDDWKQKQFVTTKLWLDRFNPRLPDMGKNPSEVNILQELVENDKVYDLARKITENGYLPDEYLIVCKEKGKCVVVEGNRCLAACKLLINPDFAPEITIASSKVSPEFLEKVIIA